MARPTVRNVELGATALWLVGLDAAAGWRSRWRWAALPPTAVGIALLLWNDPYFTLVVALPLLAATLLGAALARSAWRAMLAGTIAAGVVGSRILDAVDFLSIDALRVPFRYPKPEEQELAEHLLYKQLPFAMGTNAEITGLPQAQADANRMVLVLLCVCGALAVVACIRRWRELPAGALTAASLIVVPTLAWYASSNMLTDGRSWRYIVMTPFALPVLLVPAARSLPAGLLRTGFLLVAGGLLVHSTWINTEAAVDTARCGLAERCVPLSTSNAERQDAAFAAWLENNAARKVLVSYFHGNMTAYLTDERVQAVTATCVDRRLHTWRWLTTESRVVAPTDRSEIVLEGGNVVGCRAADITKQIGPPREVRYFSDYQLWIYDGDITTRLPTKYA